MLNSITVKIVILAEAVLELSATQNFQTEGWTDGQT
jgi:hypothetical protein